LISQARVKELRGLSAAVIGDATPSVGVLPAFITPQVPVDTIIGPAYTVRLPSGDNLGVHVAIAEAPQSSVIIAQVEGDAEFGIWGEITSTAASHARLGGFITDSFVRDGPELMALGFPVFARGRSVRKARKADRGAHQVELQFGNAVVRPGDLAVADSDGAVVIPQDRVDEVIGRAKQILTQEERLLEGIKEGKTTLELLDLGPAAMDGR
jgi:4-hydroxy-4-methyl-2-oxoglutarate aldolase